MPQLGRVSVHAFGIPHVPIPVTPFPLPVHYHVRYGQPLTLHTEFGPEAADQPDVVEKVAARVKAAVQRLVEVTRDERKGVFA